MSKRKSIFGPSKDEIWGQIATDIGGEFIEGGFWGKDVFIYKHGEWKILLDTYTVTTSTGSNNNVNNLHPDARTVYKQRWSLFQNLS